MTTTSSMRRDALFAAAPYAVWMALMLALPSSAAGYAVRTCASAAVLAASWFALSRASARNSGPRLSGVGCAAWGALAGIAVAVLWIAPEYSGFYRDWCVIGDVPSPSDPQTSPYSPAECGWALTWARLAGSAFVIAPAEELFFRSFLYRRLQSPAWRDDALRRFDLSAFLWTAGLFALEHNRIVAAFVAGAVYGIVYVRRGIAAAVVAHVVTNLALAMYVVKTGAWAFW